jgi:hypothetical protein
VNKLLVCLLALVSIATLPNSAKAATPNSGVITGKQYLNLVGGAKPISDNPIYSISCDLVDCDTTASELQRDLAAYDTSWRGYKKKEFAIVTTGLGNCSLQDWDSCKKRNAEAIKMLGTVPLKGDEYLEQKFALMSKDSSVVRSNFNGDYTVKCPASRCLIFSSGLAGHAQGYWASIADTNSNFDLTNSNLIFHFDITKFR